MKKILLYTIVIVMASSCSIYRKYQRPEDLPVDSLYRTEAAEAAIEDTTSLGYIPWDEMFTDPHLQYLIRTGLEHNVDLQSAILRVEEAKAQLSAAKWAYAPSLNLTPQGGLSSIDGGKASWTYNAGGAVSWDIDLFGSLLNSKRGAQATLLQQQAYQQAVRSQIIGTIANTYYALLMLDGQVAISAENVKIWKEQVRTMEAMLRVGQTNESAVTQARANLYALEASYADLVRQQRETENSICSLLGQPYFPVERGTLEEQSVPEEITVSVPLQLLSNRPDVIQAEMAYASSYYNTNMARAAFYPSINLSGSAGWTNSLGQAISNPAGWLLSALGQLTMPVFNHGQLRANLKVTKAEEEIARLNYRQALLNAGEQVNNALFAIQTNKTMLEKHQAQCKDLKRTLTSTEYLFRNSSGTTYLELLTAQQSLLSAQLNTISDQYQVLQSVVTLYQALGGGRE
ncbi:MAG: efflux transporter outer membrane subunit [Bacteroidetes bacterium]|uniref:Efflux transporter outer membrane subunit n=1 Tax=Candidatus Cryptobacteroides excrementipullorum TaxID=2840761 RepID=A0A9D9NLU1_9BACT|nr:efflux transporter outer membrane subunit [Candidatus Cryptobacteroides excrementipullorum]